MGNGCTCYRNLFSQEIKIDTFVEVENGTIKKKNLYEIAKYFNEAEKEVNVKNEKKKLKKIFSYKKLKNLNTLYNTNSKNELMMKRLLEQKNIERKGPKRRETIRSNNDKFEKMIKEAIEENKNPDKNLKSNLKKKESILLNYKDKMNSMALVMGKHSVVINNLSKKKLFDHLGDIMDNELKPTCENYDYKNNAE